MDCGKSEKGGGWTAENRLINAHKYPKNGSWIEENLQVGSQSAKNKHLISVQPIGLNTVILQLTLPILSFS
jgi:hypothetical protein